MRPQHQASAVPLQRHASPVSEIAGRRDFPASPTNGRASSEDPTMPIRPGFTAVACALTCWAVPGAAVAAAAAVCEARSGPLAPTVVELYTSEGCSSCPPADQWLSSLPAHGDVLALAFHVSYWDRLGWPDRFAQAAFTQRQRAQMASSGARYLYTPQVLANGRDWRSWPALPPRRTSSLDLQLRRDGKLFTATIGAAAPPGQQRSFTGYWAVLEDGHQSAVRAGENAGRTLRHDHVVRHLEPVAAWAPTAAQRLSWQDTPARPAEPGVRRRVAFVVVDAASGEPLQALALGC